MIAFIFTLLVFLKTSQIADGHLTTFAASNRDFTIDIYQKLRGQNASNLIVSPLSAEMVLALTSEGARDTTKQQLDRALHLSSTRTVRNAIRNLNLNVSTENLKLLSANRVFVGTNFQPLLRFQRIARTFYRAEAENVDFADSPAAANTINQWVEEQTNDKIQNLIDPTSLNAGTVLVLVDALYFSGKWATPFLSRSTYEEDFYSSPDTKVPIKMMHSANSFRYNYDEYRRTKFLELAYQDTNITMTFVLPDEINGLARIENNLEQYLGQQPYESVRVSVTLPLFYIEQTTDFKEILQQLGVIDLFTDNADLSGISRNGRLKVDFIVQKAVINVTEEGTEAAAATAVVVGLTAVLQPPTETFKANHPFLFLLKDSVTGVILFMGRFENKNV